MSGYDVAAVRARFAALQRGDLTFFDTPGGSQVPDSVRAAVATAMRDAAANLGGTFATSERVAQIVADARAAAGRFLNADRGAVVFGQNMTSLNFALSRALARDLKAGDEIVVTRLDHDASVSPWLEVAHDTGAVVRTAGIDEATGTLDLADLEAQLNDRTRVVAFTWAANSIGTLVDAAQVCALAHSHGALAWIDATHAAAHVPVDVEALGADVLTCSPYKFCGPHLGLAYGRPEVLEAWRPYKVRPAPDAPVGSRFETGTQPYEQLAGFTAAVDYWHEVDAAGAGHAHAMALGQRLLDGLRELDGARLIGRPTMEGRVPTFLVAFEDRDAATVADALVARGIAASASDSFYCLGLKDLYARRGALRLGVFHYTTADEIDAVLAGLTAALA
ncbi:MAG TPA: cysteine desulfurase-like protein [Baekduia sp.]|uniref:cysteine desulfurase-like protein n=1 Tax=Baekduia sp. TaxID=2600305 RepID=UPI002D792BC3|nr:cysteine desulfurase-like protein [Baekduia sp.]HET6508095.1 cysteine desulfurase-like protein [Baekduia sp.]